MQQGSEVPTVVSSLPRSWETERGFHDALYQWMERAPWVAISAAVHGAILLVMFCIPWDLLEKPKEVIVISRVERVPEAPFLDPPLPEVVERVEHLPTEDPRVEDEAIDDHNEDDHDSDQQELLGDSDSLAPSPFQGAERGDVIGIGAGAGSPYRGRAGDRAARARGHGTGTEEALTQSLEWLAAHQSLDGSWDCDGFTANCGRIQAGSSCDGGGEATHDVGMTGLAVLAFLGDGSTTRDGPYREQVARGLQWLKAQQDADSGLLGERVGHSFLYDHSIATLALCEAYYFSRNPLLKRTAQDAVNYVTRARNPYGAWRYDVPPTGDNDTSITGWCVFALASAQEGGLAIDPEAFTGAAQWISDVTDPATGRTGYTSVGSASSRVPGLNDQHPTDRGEAMTAVAILSRIFLGQDVERDPLVDKGADLLRKRLPEWDESGLGNDIYYWYYGSYALFQLGGPRWEAWNKAAKRALLLHQRRDGDLRGSWDPKDAWGHAGGRVYMTALGALCLEVYFRYSRVLGGR